MSRDNYNPYRIVGAKKIDVWFYEEGDMRRTHRIVYELIVLPLYGVCENSFLDYRHHSDELLELFIQPPYIEVPLWLMVMTVKKMPVHEANRFFELLRTKMDRIFRKRPSSSSDCSSMHWQSSYIRRVTRLIAGGEAVIGLLSFCMMSCSFAFRVRASAFPRPAL